jgi:hypothetical protein
VDALHRHRVGDRQVRRGRSPITVACAYLSEQRRSDERRSRRFGETGRRVGLREVRRSDVYDLEVRAAARARRGVAMGFRIEEATIDGIHDAMRAGEVTSAALVDA